jgi:hypothetical protein
MFEGLISRAARLGEARALARARQIAADAEAAVPRGVRVSLEDGAVRFRGKGLLRRFLVDPALRWLTELGR